MDWNPIAFSVVEAEQNVGFDRSYARFNSNINDY